MPILFLSMVARQIGRDINQTVNINAINLEEKLAVKLIKFAVGMENVPRNMDLVIVNRLYRILFATQLSKPILWKMLSPKINIQKCIPLDFAMRFILNFRFYKLHYLKSFDIKIIYIV